MIINNGVTYRNLQEQVAKNKADIEACLSVPNIITVGTITENKTIQVTANTTYYINCSLLGTYLLKFIGAKQLIIATQENIVNKGVDSATTIPTLLDQSITFGYKDSYTWRIDIDNRKVAIVSLVLDF